MESKPGFGTLAVHAGQDHDSETGAVMTPIYATSTYAQEAPGQHKGFEYARTKNPTRSAFERCVAELEGGTEGLAFASGLAAEAAVLDLLPAGSHIVALDDLYGGTYRLFENVKRNSAGLEVSYVDMTRLETVEQAIRPETRMIWCESPSNPLLKLVDMEAISKLAHDKRLMTVMDNTFATPFNQRPLESGFDITLHSVTKYLNGHSDVVAGVLVVGDNPDLAARLRFIQKSVGAILSPFDSFLAMRGAKTLELRMERHNHNGVEVANYLQRHPKVSKVIYPGLETHPQHELANRQMRGFGGMVSFEINTDPAGVDRFFRRLKIFTVAESLGGVESLANLPAAMTHASIPREVRLEVGVTDTLVRLSMGIENAQDLKADLSQALDEV
ncbi:MAG: trans-sulfuration enzyme family protein [Fimbriimonadaceae bacterium]